MKRRKSALKGIVSFLAAFALAFAMFGCAAPADSTSNTTAARTQSPTHDPVELQIYAANSLASAMDEIQTLYTESHSWVTFSDTQYLSSGDLVTKMQAGDYVDLLVTASSGSMQTAEDASLIDKASRFNMFSNDLVIVAKTGSGLKDVTLQDIASGKYTVSVGDESVPAGNYACQALSTVGAYSDPSGKTGKDITGKGGTFTGISPVLDSSVGNVCKKAESGEVDVAIVYSSDVYRFGGVEIVGTISADVTKAIIYPAAITAGSDYPTDVQAFLDWAKSDPSALQVWQKWGFELI